MVPYLERTVRAAFESKASGTRLPRDVLARALQHQLTHITLPVPA
jgi:hypothetical protein